jgi:hypothetical protein
MVRLTATSTMASRIMGSMVVSAIAIVKAT